MSMNIENCNCIEEYKFIFKIKKQRMAIGDERKDKKG